MKKRCRILNARGLGVSLSFIKNPKIGGYGGLNKDDIQSPYIN
jgi:hypothetical protein